MPQPKKGRKISFWATERAWEKLEGKSNISKLVNKAVENMDEQPLEIHINECKHYLGVSEKNPDLILCNDNPLGKPFAKPKLDCQAHKYYKENSIILFSISKLRSQHQTEKEAVSNFKAQKETLKTDIEKLQEEYQAVNVPDLQEKLKVALEVVREKNEQLAALQTDYEHLNEQIQASKIQQPSKPLIPQPIIPSQEVKIVYQDRLELLLQCPHKARPANYLEDCPQCVNQCYDYTDAKATGKLPYHSKIKIKQST